MGFDHSYAHRSVCRVASQLWIPKVLYEMKFDQEIMIKKKAVSGYCWGINNWTDSGKFIFHFIFTHSCFFLSLQIVEKKVKGVCLA